jgi:hemolysin D
MGMIKLRKTGPGPDGTAFADASDLADTPLALLEFQSPTAAIIAMPVPPVARSTTMLVAIMVALLLIVGATVRINKVVTAQGKLVSTAPTIVMQPFGTAIVQSIAVHEGEIVHKGELLARLNPTFATADLTALNAQVGALDAEQARLQAEASGASYAPPHPNAYQALQAAIFAQRKAERIYRVENYDQKIAELQMIVSKSEREAGYYKKRVNVAQAVEGMREKLQRLQVGSRLNSLMALNDQLSVSSSLASAVSTAAAGERDLAAQRAERDAFEKKWQADISEQLAVTNNKLVTAQQDLAKARLQDQLVVLRAPHDAIVLTVSKMSVGSVMQSGEKLISLMPIDAPLVVEADISGSESGFVHVGDPVTVNFDTLDFLRYGSAKGTVQSVSADSFNPQAPAADGESSLPNRPHTLYYRSRITLDELMLHNTPAGFRLVPGMPLNANIKVGRRTILSYFLTKIMPVAYDSMHEP